MKKPRVIKSTVGVKKYGKIYLMGQVQLGQKVGREDGELEKGVLVEFKGVLGAGVLVLIAGVVMWNKDCFHDLKPVGFIVAIYYFSLVD